MSPKIVFSIQLALLSLLFSVCPTFNLIAQQAEVKEDSMLKKFYDLYQKPLFWLSSNENSIRATEWLRMIEGADPFGAISGKIESEQIRVALLNKSILDDAHKEQIDRQITGLVLNFIKELQEGNIRLDYDEIRVSRDSIYIDQLLKSSNTELVQQTVLRLECRDHDFLVLQKFLKDSITKTDTLKYKEVVLAMNYRRYFAVNHPLEYILVNIPETEAKYYRNDILKLKMHTVVGRKDKPTPTIASYMTNIVTFPRWNVPHTIGVKEILPKVQKNDNYLEQNNFEVVNSKGKVVDDAQIKWESYNETNFPYYFRQATGSRNSMGVLKFNFQNPFDIFLHSTSWKGAFAMDYRFLSHGCIRLEKPNELAQILLPDKIDIKQLKVGKKNTASKTIKLPVPIPVFIIYVPVKVVGAKVVFLPDVYGLVK
jgi:L,D-transpeptidase YcbB